MKQLIQYMGMLMLLFGLPPGYQHRLTLVKDGKATSRIVLVEKNEVNEQSSHLAARLCQTDQPGYASDRCRYKG